MNFTNNLFDINPILKITKKITNNTDNFNNYYHNKSNSLYIKQLPYILNDKFKKFNFQNFRIKNPLIKKDKDENLKKNNNNNNNYLTYSNFTKNEYFKSLDKLRKVTNRSKKIPILCPLFNDQGELIPNSITTNKIFPTGFQKFNEFSNYNNTIGYFPLNKYKLKEDFNSFSVSSSNNINIENNFIENFFENKINNKISIYDILKSNNENIINKKIEKMKKEKITNLTTKLEKNFSFGNENKAIVQLKSIIIIFEEIDNNNNENKNLKKNEIILPFDLIPLFYYKNIEFFKEILISLIKFNDNFDTISIDEKEIYSIIKNEEINENSNEKEKINETKETEENNNDNENVNNLKLVNKQDLNNLFTNIQTEKKYKIKDYEQFPNEKKISKNNFNIYKFNWNTPKKNFKVSIQLPLIIFNITNKKIIINKFIDKKLLFFLFSNNFLDFDYYCISYLLTFKKFRNILQKLTNHLKNKIYKEFFFILPPKIFEDDENNISIKNVFTNSNKINFLYEIINFHLKVVLIDDLNLIKKNYKIYFNFKQIKKFRKLENFIDIINVFILFLNIDKINNKIQFDYEKFNDFDEENWIKEIKKYNSKNYFIFRNEKNNKTKIEYYLNEKIRIKIEFKMSILNEINFDGKGNKIKKSHFIDNDLERKIYKNNENFEKLFENIHKSNEIK